MREEDKRKEGVRGQKEGRETEEKEGGEGKERIAMRECQNDGQTWRV